MKRLCLFAILWVLLLSSFKGNTQDFSNKGKDFWVGYGYHQVMKAGNVQEMVLYFATEAVTTVTVSIPALGYSQTYSNIPANTVFTSNPLPKSGAQDARLINESSTPENKGIHITSDKPIVAYAHIYNASVSGASILFPTNTLGREYYSVNYKNVSNTADANCWFYVVACDTGITTVEITPSANTISHASGVPFTVNLTQGQIYNLMGEVISNANPFTTVDLTGSKIRSISSGTGGCKRIGVFSGSGRISITCNNTSSSSDNYMVQAFPKTAWGKKYLTAPTGGTMQNNFFRICVADPATAVKINGVAITATLQNNFFYDLPISPAPQLIEADQPILVAQYITSQGACGNGAMPGDPEVIYLSPVEQNINKVLWNATSNFNITQHFFNVIIPNTGTAISSFKLDGTVISAASFTPHPQAAGYSYLTRQLSAGQHIIESDSGFNAIAYGYGNAESYGYNAGTNVRDLYQFVTLQNQYATVNFPSTCKGTPFFFSMTFPYQPAQIQWKFNGLFPDATVTNPTHDSTWTINDKQLYRYKLPGSYSINTAGTYPVKVIVQNPTPDGCSGEQEIDYEIQVFDPPVINFTFTSTGCLSDSVSFTDNTNTSPRTAAQYWWDFGDGNTATTKNPKNKYAADGSYNVRHTLITDVGCLADTAKTVVNIAKPPVAKFSPAVPYCVGKAITFNDESTIAAASIAKWYWDFGDATPQVIATTNTAQKHTYSAAGTYTVTLVVESSTGCKSNAFSMQVSVYPNPLANFAFGNACLPVGAMQFTDQSTISDGSQGAFTYQWNFGDGGTATAKDPVHNYSSVGPFNATLTVTSNNGCTDDSTRVVNTIYAQPQAAFTAPAEVCDGAAVNFTDQSTAANSTITAWQWDFGDGTKSTIQNPSKKYNTYGTYTVSLTVTSAIGCVSAVTTKSIIVNQLPDANFNVSSPKCINQDITFTDASLPHAGNIVKWTWDYGDATNAVLANNAPFAHNYASANTYNATLQVETNKGCISTVLSKPVRVTVLPVADFAMPENCLNDPFSQFTDKSTIADGTQSQFTYLWTFGDANSNAGNPNTSSLKNPQHKYVASGVYNVSLNVTSADGCFATITQPFTVNGAVPQASFTVNGGNSICSNTAVSITNNSTVDFGNVTKIEVYWDYSNDPTKKSIDEDPVAGKVYTYKYAEFALPATQTHTIRMISYSGNNCLSSKDETITLKAAPALAFDAIQGMCADVPAFQLTQAREVNGEAGSGTFSGTGVSSAGIFTPSVAGAGNHIIRYTFAAANGCTNYIEQTVPVYLVPVVSAGPDKFLLQGGVVTLSGSGRGDGISYLWTPATALSNPAIPNPAATPVDDITYRLTVNSVNGCSAFDEVFVKVLREPVIPNVFTPNGDGKNDKWIIPYLESYPGSVVEVYNRYGQIIFRSVGYDKPWDGTYNGKDVPAGTYYFIVDPKNGRKKTSGFVDVVR